MQRDGGEGRGRGWGYGKEVGGVGGKFIQADAVNEEDLSATRERRMGLLVNNEAHLLALARGGCF